MTVLYYSHKLWAAVLPGLRRLSGQNWERGPGICVATKGLVRIGGEGEHIAHTGGKATVVVASTIVAAKIQKILRVAKAQGVTTGKWMLLVKTDAAPVCI